MTSIEFKVGGNSILIEQAGITIKGMEIKATADMNLTAKGGIAATLEGAAICNVKGGIVKIN